MLRICAFILFLFTYAAAQIDCDVTINIQSIPAAADRLQSFEQDIENYINSNKWSTDDLGGEKIKCSLNIFFVGNSSDNSYQAQAFIGSTRPIYVGDKKSDRKTPMVRIFDDKWEFTYTRGQPLYQSDAQFDALTDFIDFYIYLILGFDFDSYEKLGGTPYFLKAQNTVHQVPSGNKGWERGTASTYNKYMLMEDITNPKNQPFREGWYLYHYKGLDLLATKPDAAYKNMVKFVENIAEIKKTSARGLLFRTFFETKYEELADVFKGYNDRSIYQLLIGVDQAHQNAYEQAAKGQ